MLLFVYKPQKMAVIDKGFLAGCGTKEATVSKCCEANRVVSTTRIECENIVSTRMRVYALGETNIDAERRGNIYLVIVSV